MKKRTTRRLGKHMDNICFELSLIFFVSPLHEGRLEIASWLREHDSQSAIKQMWAFAMIKLFAKMQQV